MSDNWPDENCGKTYATLIILTLQTAVLSPPPIQQLVFDQYSRIPIVQHIQLVNIVNHESVTLLPHHHHQRKSHHHHRQ